MLSDGHGYTDTIDSPMWASVIYICIRYYQMVSVWGTIRCCTSLIWPIIRHLSHITRIGNISSVDISCGSSLRLSKRRMIKHMCSIVVLWHANYTLWLTEAMGHNAYIHIFYHIAQRIKAFKLLCISYAYSQFQSMKPTISTILPFNIPFMFLSYPH